MQDIPADLDDDRGKNWSSLKDPKEIASAIHRYVQEIESRQSSMRDSWKKYARAYSGRDELGLDWSSQANTEVTDSSFVTENVVKSVIDTAASIIAKNRVKPRILTNGGDFSEQRRARRMEKFIYGEMHYQKCWDLGPSVFRDSCITGTGVLKIFEKDKKIRYERRLISDIVVDERRCLDGRPRELFERRLVDKEVLLAQFPKMAQEITDAGREIYWCDGEVPTGQIVVIETWLLGKKPRHIMSIDGVILYDEKPKDAFFPFVFFRWDGLPVSGFYGLGLARDIYGIQVRINEINVHIKKCQDLISVPRVFVNGSSALKVQFDNQIGAIIPYAGTVAPVFHTAQAVSGEVYDYKEQLKRAAFEFAGISQMSAHSLKPEGLESAVALREFSDIETNRFVIQSQRYERMYTDLGELTIRVAASAYSRSVNMTSRFPNKNLVKQIKWSDVDMERDRFTIDIQPASLMSMSPSARMQSVTELAQVGQLEKNEIRYLLGHPDVEASNSLAYADYEDATRVEELLLNGDYETPEPFQNHTLLIRRLQLTYLRIRNDYEDVPEEVYQGIRDYVSACKSLMEISAQAGVAPQAAGPEGLAAPLSAQMGPENLPGQPI